MALILTQSEVRQLLPMDSCMDLMEQALASLSRGESLNPLRWPMWLADRSGLLGMMPGLAAPQAFGLKVVGVFPGNHGTELDSHQGVVVLFDKERGVPLAILEASAITEIRTAATSGVATRLLAREDAGDLAILGSGVQASSHLAAMALARKLRRVRVYSPDAGRLGAFVERESGRHGLRIEAVGSAREAVLGADLICTTTSAHEPILQGQWLAEGVHINAAGASIPSTRELDTDAVKRSRLFVDRRESTLNEAGDFLFPKREGALGDEHILGEIGELLLGQVEGRRSREEITLFKSLGLAVEDLAAAQHVYTHARERGVGVSVDLSGLKHVQPE